MDEIKQPKISIILPTYNGSKYIQLSIDSCLNQTHKNIELIIVDDASSDSTSEIIKTYNDKRINYIRHRYNSRLPRALNTGFSHATGDYLTWTSDDNQYLPNALEVMLDYLNKSDGFDFVYADYWEYFVEKGEKKIRKLPDKLSLQKECQIGACFLYSRPVFKAIKWYNPKLELVEDYDYWIRVSKRFNFVHCPEPLYIYTFHSASLTSIKFDLQVLFDKILKYKYGYISLPVLKKSIFVFFERNICIKKRKEGILSIMKTLGRVYRASLISGSIFLGLFVWFILSKIIRLALNRLFSLNFISNHENSN